MAIDDQERVKVLSIDQKRAVEGLALMTEKKDAELDSDAANKFKEEVEAKIATLDAEASLLIGKDNKKARQEKDKEKAGLKADKQYIDACKVAKGLQPPNGFFIKKDKEDEDRKEKEAEAKEAAEEDAKAEEGGNAAKKDKPVKKEQESAGISRAERDELEKIKNDIIAKKKALKDQGMSGGQMNKDEEIVKWVTRMNDLKEKENPGALVAAKDEKKGKKKKNLDTTAQALLEEKQKALEEYLEYLRTEFK